MLQSSSFSISLLFPNSRRNATSLLSVKQSLTIWHIILDYLRKRPISVYFLISPMTQLWVRVGTPCKPTTQQFHNIVSWGTCCHTLCLISASPLAPQPVYPPNFHIPIPFLSPLPACLLFLWLLSLCPMAFTQPEFNIFIDSNC